MKVYVARHGVTELNKKNLINGSLEDPLAPEGRKQARAAALLLPDTIRHIYSSSLERARETAEILNEKAAATLTFHDELQEVDFGNLNGTPFLDEIKNRHAALDYDWRPSGECFEDVKRRVLKILRQIRSENESGEALIVAHGGIIRMMHFLEVGEPLGVIANASIRDFDLDTILANS